MGHSRPVGAVRCHRIIGVRNVDNPRFDRDSFARLAVGIPAAIPVLMMQFHRRKIWRQSLHPFQNAAPGPRVLLDQREFFPSETARLLQDTVGNADLANIVQQSANPDSFNLTRIEIERRRRRAREVALAASDSGGKQS
jgi:hypothetical protein